MTQVATSRRDVMRALAAVPPTLAISNPALADTVQPNLWDQAVTRWQIACARQDAFCKVGPMREANDRFDQMKHDLIEHFGSMKAAKADPIGARELARVFDATTVAEEQAVSYFTAAEHAATLLLRTPAPNVDAVQLKIRVVKEHGLTNDLGTEPWRIISADLDRLGGAA